MTGGECPHPGKCAVSGSEALTKESNQYIKLISCTEEDEGKILIKAGKAFKLKKKRT